MLMIVCVLSDLTCLPLLGGGRKSWYIINEMLDDLSSTDTLREVYLFSLIFESRET